MHAYCIICNIYNIDKTRANEQQNGSSTVYLAWLWTAVSFVSIMSSVDEARDCSAKTRSFSDLPLFKPPPYSIFIRSTLQPAPLLFLFLHWPRSCWIEYRLRVDPSHSPTHSHEFSTRLNSSFQHFSLCLAICKSVPTSSLLSVCLYACLNVCVHKHALQLADQSLFDLRQSASLIEVLMHRAVYNRV